MQAPKEKPLFLSGTFPKNINKNAVHGSYFSFDIFSFPLAKYKWLWGLHYLEISTNKTRYFAPGF